MKGYEVKEVTAGELTPYEFKLYCDWITDFWLRTYKVFLNTLRSH